MTFIAYFALIPMQQSIDVDSIVRDELNGVANFSLRGVTNTQGNSFMVSGRAVRESDGASASLVVNRIRDTSDPMMFWISAGSATASIEPEPGFSNLPIGENNRRSLSGGAAGLRAHDGRIFVTINIHYRGRRSPSGTEWLSSDADGDKQVCEGLARRTLGRVRGLTAQEAPNINVNGTSVESITGPRGERLVDLARYCQAYNLQLNINQLLGTASFAAGGHQVIIPLAANKIKDGARWIDTTDISVIKGGKWYVSYGALQDARGH